MGKSSDKRKARRDARRQQERRIRDEALVQRVAEEEVAKVVAPKPVWAELLANEGTEGLNGASLDRMLFHLAAGFASASSDAPWSERLSVASKQIASWIPADTVSVALENDGVLELCSLYANFDHDEEALKQFLAHDDVYKSFKENKILASDDVARDARFPTLHGQKSHIGSLCVVPFDTGVLFVSRKEVGGLPASLHHNLTRIARGLGADILRVQSLIDVFTCQVTGLRSRAALLVDLPLSVTRARRYNAPLSAVLFEINDLSAWLSDYGANAERLALEEVSKRLRGAVRGADAAARLGRASILLVIFEDEEGATLAAKRLHAVMTEKPIVIADVEMKVRMRAGVAEIDAGDDGFALLAKVENAFHAKPLFEK